ncbi:hypothetical protein CDL15_Pgr013241 [Punica granatum]|nr:hypothetical protein CDL15_Pgr013241 [Punica granatum]PKI61228.1 hypothetical protein CRG98_018376 [Punica granatum]
MVRPSTGRAFTKKCDQLPSWFNLDDNQVLEAGMNHELVPDVVVAQDGTGNHRTITEAVKVAPINSTHRHVIPVEKGVYREKVEIKNNNWNTVMVGQGMDATIVSWNQSVGPNVTTYKTATFSVTGRGFIACNMTFKNTAGPEWNQSVALRSDSDMSVFFRGGIRAYQDTLYPHSFRQFYRECQISGTIDFICGNAAAVFQYCEILVRRGRPDEVTNTITANSRSNGSETTGFSFQRCNILADSSLVLYVNMTNTFLGRPWRKFSMTVFMKSYMTEIIHPLGWVPWNASRLYLETLYYEEYQNHGPRARTTGRVNWSGYHLIDSAEASNFTVARLIEGDLWLTSTGIAYASGLDPETRVPLRAHNTSGNCWSTCLCN